MLHAALKIITVTNNTLVKCTDESEIPIKNPTAIPIIAVMITLVPSLDLLSALQKQ